MNGLNGGRLAPSLYLHPPSPPPLPALYLPPPPQYLHPGPRIPQPHGLIRTPTGQLAPIWRPGDCEHRSRVPFEGAEGAPAGGIPQAHGLVVGGGGELGEGEEGGEGERPLAAPHTQAHGLAGELGEEKEGGSDNMGITISWWRGRMRACPPSPPARCDAASTIYQHKFPIPLDLAMWSVTPAGHWGRRRCC